MENKDERVEDIIKEACERSKLKKEAIEDDDWELYKKSWLNYDNKSDYNKDFVRLMFETEKLEHKGATPFEVFIAQFTGLLRLCEKHNIDQSKVLRELSERYNIDLNIF